MDQTLKHKIGQMIIAGFPSAYVDDQARHHGHGCQSPLPIPIRWAGTAAMSWAAWES